MSGSEGQVSRVRTLLLTGMLCLWAASVPTSAQAQKAPLDTVRIASLTGFGSTMFPNSAWSWGTATLAPLMYDALTQVEEGGQILPALATRWRAENDHLWVFDLRRDVRFSNGEPFTSEAVVSAIEFLQTQEGRTLLTSGQVANITRVETRGDYTVALHTAEPDALLPARMRVIYMLPPDHFADVGRTGFMLAPHGTGPFMVEELGEARSEFVANPYAWRPPKLPKLTWLKLPDGISRVQAILSEAVDIAFSVGPGAEQSVQSAGAWVDAVYTAGVDTMPFITTRESPVQDKRVRLAVNYAVNKAQIAATLLEGGTQPATQFVPPGVFGYDPALPVPFPHDLERARALLTEAGYPDGVDLTVELYLDSTEKAAVIQQIVSDLAEASIRLKVATSTVYDIQQRGLQGGRWEGEMMSLPYIGFPTFDALAVFNVHSCLWHAPFHCDPGIVERVLDARATFDPDARLQKARAIHQSLIEDPAALLLFDSVRYFVIGKRVSDYRAPFGIIQFHELGLTNE